MVWGGLDVVPFAVVWWWFGANMAGRRHKNAFKFLLQLLILSQKQILGVRKVFWDGLEVVWVFPRTLTGRITSQKNISFRG